MLLSLWQWLYIDWYGFKYVLTFSLLFFCSHGILTVPYFSCYRGPKPLLLVQGRSVGSHSCTQVIPVIYHPLFCRWPFILSSVVTRLIGFPVHISSIPYITNVFWERIHHWSNSLFKLKSNPIFLCEVCRRKSTVFKKNILQVACPSYQLYTKNTCLFITFFL